jgi:hypothetical protein
MRRDDDKIGATILRNSYDFRRRVSVRDYLFNNKIRKRLASDELWQFLHGGILQLFAQVRHG